MAQTWEYKVLTLKRTGFTFTQTPTDDEARIALNREGSQGWELVNAVCAGLGQPILLFLKRPG